MLEKDEQIAPQQATSDEQVDAQQTLESSTQGQSDQVDGTVPEKFAGKSATEIAQAYKELEKDRGRLASELGSIRKEREDMESRFRLLEQSVARYNSMPVQVSQQAQQPAIQDPFEVLEKRFDEDPKAAIKETMKLQQEMLRRQQEAQLNAQLQQEASQYYWTQKKDNPDYARREPIMQELQSQFRDVIKPEFLNSKKVLEALDLMSRGRDVDYYTKQALVTAQKNGSAVREEKRRAASESASSVGEQTRDTSKLSASELASFYGLRRSDD